MLLLSRIKNGYDFSATAMYFERGSFEHEAPKSRKRSTQNSKTKHPISKTKHPKLENEDP